MKTVADVVAQVRMTGVRVRQGGAGASPLRVDGGRRSVPSWVSPRWRRGSRIGTALGRGARKTGSGRSSCRSRRSGKARRASRPSWSRADVPSRRSSLSCGWSSADASQSSRWASSSPTPSRDCHKPHRTRHPVSSLLDRTSRAPVGRMARAIGRLPQHMDALPLISGKCQK